MHRDSFRGRWALDAGDRAGDSLAAFARHDQFRQEAMTARMRPVGRTPVRRSLVAWVHQLRSGAEPEEGAPGSGRARAPRRPFRTLIDRLRVVVFRSCGTTLTLLGRTDP
jgi:hypothetical protein